MVTCPVCGRRSIGKVGVEQYYCWDCCVEFVSNGQEYTVFSITDDGSLTLFDESLQDSV
ncbi:hypothetical protein SDC9_30286 [bioreactor metagenome]|uniref:Uncharacterized protein n=1 Tax=bioreactor metagenome TaxID=1076179 RepID=A0A644UZF7_9ZZZZ